MIAIILAAGLSKRLRPITNEAPKCLLEIGGQTMISRYLDILEGAGIDKTLIITGFNHDAVVAETKKVQRKMEIETILNPDFEKTGNHPIDSFLLTKNVVDEDFLLLNSDIYFSAETITKLVESPNSCVAIDSSSSFIEGEMFVDYDSELRVTEISKFLKQRDTNQGKSIQVVKFVNEDKDTIYSRAEEISGNEKIFYPAQAFDTLIEQKRFFVVDAVGEFSHELDTVEDYNSLISHIKND